MPSSNLVVRQSCSPLMSHRVVSVRPFSFFTGGSSVSVMCACLESDRRRAGVRVRQFHRSLSMSCPYVLLCRVTRSHCGGRVADTLAVNASALSRASMRCAAPCFLTWTPTLALAMCKAPGLPLGTTPCPDRLSIACVDCIWNHSSASSDACPFEAHESCNHTLPGTLLLQHSPFPPATPRDGWC